MEEDTINSILKYVLKSKHSQFLGVFTLKQFKSLKIKNKKCALILFIDTINSKKGHWVTIIKINKILYFMDSYGLSPNSYMKKIGNQYVDIKYYFLYRLQTNFSTICGVYAIFFVHLIIACEFNLAPFANAIIDTFNKFKFKENDRKMKKYIFKAYPFFDRKQCKNLFCNSNFTINFKKCYESLCHQN